ncbi:uncharacterized protein L969DRAFT_14491 [Mixia osmundae IAM 14324]|uniref:Uncharacterized protein n=1 Tax=Mixia osmundae (strain CBS 9802 / IAM 14324 / JCM 22182 / KY 12970) TaxID=764103 RepID=G7EAD9_MIXOS|nr:uncharacterized protein L969DRAFT_14491 [Mixia osmundae IAM 14324]KEI42290.1 hypothetical protein L969DRAFT_14491 [Mixia osmundae IAM 14324]GAA99799.1 hypothetical protein E5Q_06502 [Mixia osmundae IAM 14324]
MSKIATAICIAFACLAMASPTAQSQAIGADNSSGEGGCTRMSNGGWRCVPSK